MLLEFCQVYLYSVWYCSVWINLNHVFHASYLSKVTLTSCITVWQPVIINVSSFNVNAACHISFLEEVGPQGIHNASSDISQVSTWGCTCPSSGSLGNLWPSTSCCHGNTAPFNNIYRCLAMVWGSDIWKCFQSPRHVKCHVRMHCLWQVCTHVAMGYSEVTRNLQASHFVVYFHLYHYIPSNISSLLEIS